MRRGFIQVYTGTGKGKTTAALGLVLRAAGAGMKVVVLQFIKKKRCSEHKALGRFDDLVQLKQFGRGFILRRSPNASDIAAAKAGLREARSVMEKGLADLLVLDEVNVAVNRGLLTVDELLDLMEMKPPKVELILTGRYAEKKILAKADLVTEMREIKHYAKKGVRARVGIEK